MNTIPFSKCKHEEHSRKKTCCCGGHNTKNHKSNKKHNGTLIKLNVRNSMKQAQKDKR